MATTAHQTWSPEQYAQQARFVSDLGMPVVELLAPRAGERILDLGCGDGSITKKLDELGCQVVGVDASPPEEYSIYGERDKTYDSEPSYSRTLRYIDADGISSTGRLH